MTCDVIQSHKQTKNFTFRCQSKNTESNSCLTHHWTMTTSTLKYNLAVRKMYMLILHSFTQRQRIAPLVFVRPDAALDNFLHLGNGHFVKAARFHSLQTREKTLF